ncbi:hypothetical protein [Streptomyces sp. ITFR-6]|uniref:hypothetical protein n=1 Tax=Streptomyces sp. ITFR-6 TaxID=3075197 RepID=UPI00288B55DF|nr:hypothetical protein [Streptomyces sp. ITFR-6]WNI31474.1 hypothetical protein RLT59_23795 [Streptomyces sp. ITFR-6]
MMPAPDPAAIFQALALGVTGDHQGGLDALQPLVDAGPASTFALLASLAETASKEAREANGPDTFYGTVVGPDGEGDIGMLPPPIRFAARFITAWANRDRDTAHALFWAVVEPSDRNGTSDLSDAITAVYGMAVAAAEHLVLEQRRKREGTT